MYERTTGAHAEMGSADMRMRFVALRMPFVALRMRSVSGISDLHTGIWILYARVFVSRTGGCDPLRRRHDRAAKICACRSADAIRSAAAAVRIQGTGIS